MLKNIKSKPEKQLAGSEAIRERLREEEAKRKKLKKKMRRRMKTAKRIRRAKRILGSDGFRLLTAGALVTGFLIRPEKPKKAAVKDFRGRNFAHRGLHTEDKSIPENSLPAFDKAAEKGYGSELDVQLSRDGKVFVFHDDSLERVSGKPGNAEDYTWEELSGMKLCGTEYTIPLFTQVLETVGGRTPLIVELKSTKRYRELSRKTLEILKDYAKTTGGSFCVESFDPRIVRWFRIHAPKIVRGQLASPAGDLAGEDPTLSKRIISFGVANLLTNAWTRPNFIAYKIGKKPILAKACEGMGAFRVSWTSLSPENEKHADAVIFQFYEPRAKYK